MPDKGDYGQKSKAHCEPLCAELCLQTTAHSPGLSANPQVLPVWFYASDVFVLNPYILT